MELQNKIIVLKQTHTYAHMYTHTAYLERYKGKNLDGILELQNKTPVWNDETQSYVLNFHGRVTQVFISYKYKEQGLKDLQIRPLL